MNKKFLIDIKKHIFINGYYYFIVSIAVVLASHIYDSAMIFFESVSYGGESFFSALITMIISLIKIGGAGAIAVYLVTLLQGIYDRLGIKNRNEPTKVSK